MVISTASKLCSNIHFHFYYKKNNKTSRKVFMTGLVIKDVGFQAKRT